MSTKINKLFLTWILFIYALKQSFDPHNIMNPGGTLGLDISEEQKNKHWVFIK